MFCNDDKHILHKIWKLQGLLPYYYDKEGNYRFYSASLFLGLFYLVLSFSLFSWIFYEDLNKNCTSSIKTVNKIMTVVTCCNISTLSITSILCIVFASINAQNLSEIRLLIYQTKKQLGILNQWNKVDNNGLLLQSFYTVWLFIDSFFNKDNIKYNLSRNALLLILFSVEIQVLTMSIKISFLFKSLNKQVSQILSKHTFFPRILPSVDILKDKNFNLISYCKIHWTLCQTINIFNSSFGVQILAIFFMTFLHTISAPFYLITILSQDFSHLTTKVILNVCWLFIDIALFILIIWPCAMAADQGSKTSAIIRKYLAKDLPGNLKKQTEEFLFQLQYHKTRFFAHGIIQIYWSVLTKIVGAISTYLVILIQFQSTSLTCKEED